LRLLEKLKNHSGKPSFLALRPADSAETVAAWDLLLSTNHCPAGLILSRQNIKDIPSSGASRIADSKMLEKGAYIVFQDSEDPDVILLANGSEVATLIEAAPHLQKKNLRVRVVSVPSEGLFREQSESYQQLILPSYVPVFGLTAGLPATLEGLIKDNGKVFGMTHFGYSAPYTVLDEKFGYTAENVVAQVMKLLKEQ
jgi:transketolase